MISSLRNFAKTKLAGVFVGIIILPFVFWGMGGMFSSGNTNNVAKVDKINISTQDFIDHLNNSGIPEETIKSNLDNNIIEELLSTLISKTLLELEIKDFNLIISENTLLKKIKKNKNFLDDNGVFQRIKYEKFLLENNQSAPAFELRLKDRELQKNLFNYIGAGTVSPNFLINKLYEEENKEVQINFINLKDFYKKKSNITEQNLKDFISKNNDQLKVEYLDFNYAIINPKNLIGVDEFNQAFFDKIDEIEVEISNNTKFETIVKNLNIKQIRIKDFKFSNDKNEIERKIFELRNNKFDIFENGNNYILFQIDNIEQRKPNISDKQIREEVLQLVHQKSIFDYNRELLEKIRNKEFNNDDFSKMSQGKAEVITLNSIRDNKKFEINAVEVLYSLPVNSFTLINDEENNIYLAKIIKFKNKENYNDNKFKEYIEKQNSNKKNTLLKSYDFFLNDKYNIVLNQKTINRVKNFFQ